VSLTIPAKVFESKSPFLDDLKWEYGCDLGLLCGG